eukprot:1161350-Pelagomonas_calceolata.AAC.20
MSPGQDNLLRTNDVEVALPQVRLDFDFALDDCDGGLGDGALDELDGSQCAARFVTEEPRLPLAPSTQQLNHFMAG